MDCAIVTGSTKGIGRVIAQKFIARGIYTIINYSSDDSAAMDFKRSLEADGYSNFTIIKQSLDSMDNLTEFTEKVRAVSEDLQIKYIVFSAGLNIKSEWGEYSYSEWCKVFDVNLNIPVMMLQKFNSCMAEDGNIIFLSSVMTKHPHSGSLPYAVSKSAVNSLVENLTKHYRDRNITVNAVIVGFTDTGMIQRTEEHKQRICSKIALNRFAQPSEIADMVMTIVDNRYINGACLDVTGGYSFQ